MTWKHTVRVETTRNGVTNILDDVLEYSVNSDMLALADDFQLGFLFLPALIEAVQPDNELTVWIDDSPVLTGFIDSRTANGEGITITGRDRGGRVVDEAAPLKTFGGRLSIVELFAEVVSPWFETVTLVNARNRQVIGGRGKRRKRSAAEPVYTAGDRDLRKKVQPGERSGDVVTELAEQAGLLVWSTGDGRELFVGLPNQDQDPAWRFIKAPPGASRHRESNVRDLEIKDDLSEFFSQITVVGASRGDRSNYGSNVTKRRATVYDAPDPDGVGNFFAYRKRHLVSDSDIRSPNEARERAERERAELGAGIRVVRATASGHGQVQRRGAAPEIFHFDFVARCEDDELDEQIDVFITRVEFQGSRDDDSTVLIGVPVGTELRING